MITKFKTGPFVLFLALVFMWAAQLQAQEAIFKKYAGTYITGHEFGGGWIELAVDGTFTEQGGSDDGTTFTSSGTYAFSNGVLTFTYRKNTRSRSGEKDLNLLDPGDLKELSYGGETPQVRREFRLLPVHWSGRIYLVYEDELKNFVNAVNFGIEPRSSLRSISQCSPWYGSFYLRKGDEKKKVSEAPLLPTEWRTFLLLRPVIASVINIQGTSKRSEYLTDFTFTINKGAKNRLRAGMRLLTQNEIPSQLDGTEIISVHATRSTVRSTVSGTERIRTGDKLTTRFVPQDPQLCKYLERQESVRESQ